MEESSNSLRKELISSYDELDLGDKRKELGREIAELTLLTEKLIIDINPAFKPKEMSDYNNLFDTNISEEKYLTGLYEDLLEMKEDISLIYSAYIGSMYSENQENN